MDIKRGLKLVLAASLTMPFGLIAGVFVLASLSDSGSTPLDPGLAGGSLKVGRGGVPSQYEGLIVQAANDCKAGLSPSILAAQLKQESGFNPKASSPAGAQGIAQFMPGTWKTWGEGGDVWDPNDAIPAQGRFMCSLLKRAKNPAKYNDCPTETVTDPSQYNGSPTELALAGYNAGWCAVERYAGVPPASFAKGQTYDYVKIIMASSRQLTLSGASGGSSGAWTRPTSGALGTVYHATGAHWSSGYHTGIDFTVPTGTTVKAVGPGTVITAGQGGAYGNQIVIRHADGKYSHYAHLSSLSVSKGDTVKGGQKIGLSGATGNVTGPHLHFEIRTGPEYGSDVNPIPYLRQHGVSI
ncbi:peptidoglycan DD-metalloendopeptidase family protein [Streptomyces sp. NPDC059590]|uniref:peptidoglycan DD-metalloendopeptidase family protein n=1 Tax=Streptomyces sp. NPDC059590 TaxID=3346877 RepID=UPI00367E80B6